MALCAEGYGPDAMNSEPLDVAMAIRLVAGNGNRARAIEHYAKVS